MWSGKKNKVPQSPTEKDDGQQPSPAVTPKSQSSFKGSRWLPSKFTARERADTQNGSVSPSGLNPASPAGSFTSASSEQTAAADSRFVHVARVVKTHVAAVPEQLTVQEGHLVLVTRVGSRGWYFGNILQVDPMTGLPVALQDAGWFPASFVISQGGSSSQESCPNCMQKDSKIASENALLEKMQKMDSNLESRLSGMVHSMRSLLDELEQRQQSQTAQSMRAEIQGVMDERLERICSSLQSCIAEHSHALDNVTDRTPTDVRKDKIAFLNGQANTAEQTTYDGEEDASGGVFRVAVSAPPKAEPESATTESSIGKRATVMRSTQLGRFSM